MSCSVRGAAPSVSNVFGIPAADTSGTTCCLNECVGKGYDFMVCFGQVLRLHLTSTTSGVDFDWAPCGCRDTASYVALCLFEKCGQYVQPGKSAPDSAMADCITSCDQYCPAGEDCTDAVVDWKADVLPCGLEYHPECDVRNQCKDIDRENLYTEPGKLASKELECNNKPGCAWRDDPVPHCE